MLALTDAALVHLFLAAGRIPQRSRGKWLRRLAHQLDPGAPTPNAQLCRDARARQRDGVSYFRIPLDVASIEQLLENEGLLQRSVDHSHHEIESALTTFLFALTDIAVGLNSGTGS
jgi:hypothetical protein